MNLASCAGVLAAVLLVLGEPPALGSGRARLLAQEPCPRASGPDAEAGWGAYAAGDIGAARARFEAALARCTDDQYARTGLGYVLLRGGEVDGAVALWNEVVASEPENVDALTGLGLAAWRRGEIEEVRGRFARILDLVPDDPTAREYLARVEGAESLPLRPVDAADDAWAAGDTASARRLYEARLAENPDDATATLRTALMRAWRGQHASALEMLDGLVGRRPADLDARLARARVRAWSGDLRAAEADAYEALALQPEHPEALEALALFRTWAGAFESALETYDALIAISPPGGLAERQRAQALAWAAEFDEAATAYRTLLDRSPEDVDARLGYAQLLAYAGDYDGSVAEYDRVLASAPQDARALSGKARALGWAGRLVAAEEAALRAVDVAATDPAAWSGLAQIYRWQGRDASAKDALETAAALAPTNAEVLDQLRSLNLAFSPVVRPSVVLERDSDDNRMLTTSMAGSWYPAPRLALRARAYRRDLEQGVFTRTAHGGEVSGQYHMGVGWILTGGVGMSETNGTSDPSFAEYRLGVTTPARYPYVVGLALSSIGSNGTAALAQRGVRATEGMLTLRWTPSPGWRTDGSVGVGSFSGTESNPRRSATLSVSRTIRGAFGAGLSMSGFSFEKDLNDGYFDPDFYGVAELTSYWLHRPGRWTVVAELAPGIQQVRRDGELGTSLRANARLAYGLGPGREVSLSVGYSSAGLVSFATGRSDYSYTAIILGSSWAF